MATFQGNAFALLEGDEGENLFASVAKASVKETAAPPSPANKHQNGDRKKALASSHEKEYNNNNNNGDRQNRNRNGTVAYNRNNNGSVNGAVAYNRNNDGAVERRNTNGAVANTRNGAVERRNRNRGANANNYNGRYTLKATNGNGHETEKKEEEEGWETVKAKVYTPRLRGRWRFRNYNNGGYVSRTNGYKQGDGNDGNYANSRGHSRTSNGRMSENSDARSVQAVEKESKESKESQGSETSAKEERVLTKEEIEKLELEAERLARWEAKKLEYELEAKKMTLKQYEKLLEEKRKALECTKTEERRVARDTSFNSMNVIAKKKNFEEDAQLKKVVSTNKDDNYASKAKKVVIAQRLPRRGISSSHDTVPTPVNVEKAVISTPPSFEDIKHFPALKSNATTTKKK